MSGYKRKISATQLGQALECSMKYFYNYIARIQRGGSLALILGSGGHAGNETYLKMKKYGRDLNIDYIKENSAKTVYELWGRYSEKERKKILDTIKEKQSIHDNNPRKKAPYVSSVDEAAARSVEATMLLVDYYESLGDAAVPVFVEESFDIPLINNITGEIIDDMTIVGKIDLSDRVNGVGVRLLDHKIVASAPTLSKVKLSIQNAIYRYALKYKYDIDAKYSGQLVVVKNKTMALKPVIAKTSDCLDPSSVFYYAKFLSNLIKSNMWVPNFGTMFCNYCEYHELCAKFTCDKDKFNNEIVKFCERNEKEIKGTLLS